MHFTGMQLNITIPSCFGYVCQQNAIRFIPYERKASCFFQQNDKQWMTVLKIYVTFAIGICDHLNMQ